MLRLGGEILPFVRIGHAVVKFLGSVLVPDIAPSLGAHCVIAGAVGTVLQAEVGNGPMPVLSTTSPTAKGATRSWTNTADFMQEVALARIYDGVHYRNSTVVGSAIGKQVGELVVVKILKRAD